jgi:hypothetical protein
MVTHQQNALYVGSVRNRPQGQIVGWSVIGGDGRTQAALWTLPHDT